MYLLAEAFERGVPSLHFPHLPAGCRVSGEVSDELTEPPDVRCLGSWVCGTSTIYPNSDDTELLQKPKTEPLLFYTIKTWVRDFPGSSVLKTWPSGAGGVDSIPGWRARIPHVLGPKQTNKQTNRSSIVTNSLKTLKMVHIKKSLSWVTMCCSSWLTLTLYALSPSTLCTSLPLPHSILTISLPATPQRLQDHSHCE